MSDKSEVKSETTIDATDMVVTIAAAGQSFAAPVIVEKKPAREVKKKTGTVMTKEVVVFRVAPFNRTSALAFAAAIFAAAEAKNSGDGDKLAERIFGRYAVDKTDTGMILNAEGRKIWDENAYAEGLFTLNSRKSAPGLDDLRKAHSVVLEQAVALGDIREEWRAAGREGIKNGVIEMDENGNPSVDPFSPEKWELVSVNLNSNERLGFNLRLDSFPALATTILNIKDRRVALEREIAELETKRAEQEKKRLATKAAKEAAAAAAAPVPASPAVTEANVAH